MIRYDGRQNNEMRKVEIERGFIEHAEGSCLIKMGETWVVTTATVEEKVPVWLKGSGQGWITSEYAMIPRAAFDRVPREGFQGKQRGRSMEIQRLIGRSLRSVVDLFEIGEISIIIDCDVIKADGGTRAASITGGFVAMYEALKMLNERGRIKRIPVKEFVAAVSLGIVGGELLLDLTYEEDFDAMVDMSLVMTESGRLIEVQASAEKKSFDKQELELLVELGEKGIMSLIQEQKKALGL